MRPELLFVGTEQGLFAISIDGGEQWAAVKGELPEVAGARPGHPSARARSVDRHTRTRHLHHRRPHARAGTRPPRCSTQDAAFLPTRPAVLVIPSTEQRFEATISSSARRVRRRRRDHLLPQEAAHVRRPEVRGVRARAARSSRRSPAASGAAINRVEWRDAAEDAQGAARREPRAAPYAFYGPRVVEGTYRVKMYRNKDTLSVPLAVVADPRSQHSREDRVAQQRVVHELYGMLADLTFLVDAVSDAQQEGRTGRSTA